MKAESLSVAFYSPPPEGYMYLGRNHAFVEQLCQYLMADSLEGKEREFINRASVIKTDQVNIKTAILLFRARNVIEDKKGKNQHIAEEMLVWGYKGSAVSGEHINSDQCQDILKTVRPKVKITPEAKAHFLQAELADIKDLKETLDQLAEERSKHLVEAHERFRKAVGSSHFKVVYPVLPMDIMGMYILLPMKV